MSFSLFHPTKSLKVRTLSLRVQPYEQYRANVAHYGQMCSTAEGPLDPLSRISVFRISLTASITAIHTLAKFKIAKCPK